VALENKEYEVEVVVTTTHLFTTFSRSVEEAESDAENLIEDGDLGEIVHREIETVEAFPVDELSDEDDDDDPTTIEDLIDD
jgi:hypothetical protein